MIDATQVAEAIGEDLREDRRWSEGRRRADPAGIPIRLGSYVDVDVVATGQQQWHDHGLVAISNNTADQPRQRGYVDVHEAERDRYVGPPPGHHPDEFADLAYAPRVRRPVSRGDQIDASRPPCQAGDQVDAGSPPGLTGDHVGTPAGSTARR